MYQAPQSAYDLFDKALVIYEGQQIFDLHPGPRTTLSISGSNVRLAKRRPTF
jgi:hypothetical protein